MRARWPSITDWRATMAPVPGSVTRTVPAYGPRGSGLQGGGGIAPPWTYSPLTSSGGPGAGRDPAPLPGGPGMPNPLDRAGDRPSVGGGVRAAVRSVLGRRARPANRPAVRRIESGRGDALGGAARQGRWDPHRPHLK